ncbi:MAG: endonuclease III domain-containing protein [Chloroflexota bacterium]
MEIGRVLELLENQYGRLERRSRRKAIDVLIQTILSQNTSDTNSGRAFASLLSVFGSWDEVASAQVEDIAAAIRSGGLYRIKAARIKEILNAVKARGGSPELEFLASVPTSEARKYLMELPGVGQKTASCVLLFALGKPSLPVDTHVYRVARRLGLIDGTISVEQAHSELERMVPADKVYEFHLHMIEHGRQVCRARSPRCATCVFREECPSSLVSRKALVV